MWMERDRGSGFHGVAPALQPLREILGPMRTAYQSGPLFEFLEHRRRGYVSRQMVEPMRAAAKAGLVWLDERLSDGRTYLCGDRFTLADIRFFCFITFFALNDPDQGVDPSLHNVASYIQRIWERPSAQAITTVRM